MPLYKVTHHVTLVFETEVFAESEDQAVEFASNDFFVARNLTDEWTEWDDAEVSHLEDDPEDDEEDDSE